MPAPLRTCTRFAAVFAGAGPGLILLGALAFAAAQDAAAKTYLLHVSQGELPTDTGTDATKAALDKHAELGQALKVELVNSFGARKAAVADWTAYSALAFAAFNPSAQNVKLTLTVRHARSVNFATRVDVPLSLKPGRNDVQLPIASMKNNNGTAADLAHVVRWYIAIEGKPATLYFGDIYLVGGGAATVAGKGAKVGSDPARLERLKKAKMPPITKPILFDTPEADAICSALEVYPPDNPWNLVIEDWPLHPNSKNIIASIGADKVLRYNPDMSFILVPPDQKKVDVKIVGYPGESDKGPFPVPDNTPIEGWPANYLRDAKLKLTLEDVQRDKLKQGGDRHAIVVDPVNRMLYEFFVMKKTDGGWQAAQSSVFDLKSNKLRPDGWTSADAAGLPIFPAVVRYDELKRGIVEHALRVTVRKSRRAYVYPATHFASKWTDVNLPRMGERIRLRRDFKIKGFSPEVTAILKGLQKYGMFVADNGIDWAISVAPDPRIPVLHEELRRLKGADFEVVTPPAGYQPAGG